MRTLILLLTGAGLIALAQQPSPRCDSVTPDTGKPDTEFAVAGENLGKDKVAEMYVTDGKNDVKVEITEQTEKSIKFKASAVKPGRYSLMILTGDRARYLEQPLKVSIQ
jgi:hypothetical protein